MIIRLFLILAIAFAAVKTYPDGFNDQQRVTIEADILTEKKANELFSSFVADQSIPFDYPIDGCYARAYKMGRIAASENVKLAKIYVDGILRVKNINELYPEVTWGYHVAPMAPVKMADGTIVDMVFDPGLFSKPVPIQNWLDKMKGEGWPEPEIANVYYGSRFQLGPRENELPKNNWRSIDIKASSTILEKHSKLSAELNETVQKYKKVRQNIEKNKPSVSSPQTLQQGVR